jgi:cephalosporin hydroxylase
MWTPELQAAAIRAQWGDSFATYKGVSILKPPNDLWSVQEIIWDTKPDLLVETGTAYGGSANWYADCGVDVISIDKSPYRTPQPHPRVEYRRGYSTSPTNVYMVEQAAEGRRVMVVLDSDHSKQNVLDELEAYARLVSQGCYLIVEDTALGRELTGTDHDDGDGPADALDEWLPDHPEFVVDRERERYGQTMHPGGYLLRQ